MTGPTSSSSSSGMSSPLKTTYRSPTLDHLLVPPLAFPDAAALNHRQVTAAQPDRKAQALEDEQIAGFELRPFAERSQVTASRESKVHPAPAKSLFTSSSDRNCASSTCLHSGMTRNHQTSGIASEKFVTTKSLPPGLTTRRNSCVAPSRSATWCQTKNSKAASHEASGNGMCSPDPAAYVTAGWPAWARA